MGRRVPPAPAGARVGSGQHLSSGARRFTSVDLPTPDEPRSAIVCPGCRYGSSSPRPSPVTALTACTDTPIVTGSTSSSSAMGSVCGIALVDDDDRDRAAVPGGREVALEPPRVEVEAESGDDEHRVDVRGHDLLHGSRVRLLARERGPPRQDGFDDRLPLALDRTDRDPVAHRGQLLVGQLPGGKAAHPAALREELARPVVTRGDARRDQVVCCVWLERIREERVPADVFQVQTELLWLWEYDKRPIRARKVSLRSAAC